MNTRLFTLFVAAILLTILPSCVEPPPGSESSIWQRPPRYGHGGTDSPKPERTRTPRPEERSTDRSDRGNDREPGSRFGYSGDDRGTPGDDVVAEADTPPGDRDSEAMASDDTKKEEDKPAAEKPQEPKSSGPPSPAQMPFAKGVPGKPLSVTLPPPYSHVGEVSIEQYEGGKPTGKPLPPGTPVEIPDPGKPGKKIYFKVP